MKPPIKNRYDFSKLKPGDSFIGTYQKYNACLQYFRRRDPSIGLIRERLADETNYRVWIVKKEST